MSPLTLVHVASGTLALFLASAGIAVAPFDADDAAEAGRNRATLKQTGLPIGPYDVLIAAQALRARATLITANAREFLRILALQVVDWAAAPAS
jgi:tRNA(fMet)-specific endonuclease VapC